MLNFGNDEMQNLSNYPALLLGHWYGIMGLYYVKSILTEISAFRQDRRVPQKSKIIRIKFLSIWGMLQASIGDTVTQCTAHEKGSPTR